MMHTFMKDLVRDNFHQRVTDDKKVEFYRTQIRKDESDNWTCKKQFVVDSTDVVEANFDTAIEYSDNRIFHMNDYNVTAVEDALYENMTYCTAHDVAEDYDDYAVVFYAKPPKSDTAFFIASSAAIPNAEYLSIAAMEADGVVIDSILMFFNNKSYGFFQKASTGGVDYTIYNKRCGIIDGGVIDSMNTMTGAFEDILNNEPADLKRFKLLPSGNDITIIGSENTCE